MCKSSSSSYPYFCREHSYWPTKMFAMVIQAEIDLLIETSILRAKLNKKGPKWMSGSKSFDSLTFFDCWYFAPIQIFLLISRWWWLMTSHDAWDIVEKKNYTWWSIYKELKVAYATDWAITQKRTESGYLCCSLRTKYLGLAYLATIKVMAL